MTSVHLRPVTISNIAQVFDLELLPEQVGLVASNVKSLAEAYADPRLVPLAIYDVGAVGQEDPTTAPMVGFTMYGLLDGVGYIIRLMIDHRHQGKGYGRAAMEAVLKRLEKTPGVDIVGTSCRRTNQQAEALYRSLGFIDWTPPWESSLDGLYLRMP